MARLLDYSQDQILNRNECIDQINQHPYLILKRIESFKTRSTMSMIIALACFCQINGIPNCFTTDFVEN